MAIKGDLRDMSLRDLIQFFRMGSKSGVLGFASKCESGMIYIAHGQMIDAIIVRSSDSRIMAIGNEAAIQLFLWKEARFVFRQDEAVSDHPVRIDCDDEWLEREAQKRRELAIDTLHPVITLDAPLELVALPDNQQRSVSLNMHQWRIISLIPSLNTLGAVCNHLHMDPEKALQATNELLELGLVQISASAVNNGTVTQKWMPTYSTTLAA
jgi:hypothetical protein